MVNTSKVKVDLIKKENIQNIWEQSSQRSVFNNPEFLKNFDYSFFWWIAKYGDEPACLWPVCKYHKKIIVPEFFYYFGPLWVKKKIENHKWLKFSNDVYNEFCKVFIEEYGSIENQLHHTLTDVRAFDWWNYHSGKRFKIFPRYSAVLENIATRNLDSILASFRYWRRHEIKNFQKKFNIEIDNKISPEKIISMYKSTFSDQNIQVSKDTEKNISHLYNATKKQFGEILAIKNKDNNEIISVALLLNDKKTSNLVLNLSNKKYKKDGCNAYLIFEVIKYLKKYNFDTLDFNGANSPNRSDDKHSYGTDYKLYFQLKY